MGADDLVRASAEAQLLTQNMLALQASTGRSDEDMAIMIEGLVESGHLSHANLAALPIGIQRVMDARSAGIVAQESANPDQPELQALAIGAVYGETGEPGPGEYPDWEATMSPMRPSGTYGPIDNMAVGFNPETGDITYRRSRFFVQAAGQEPDIFSGASVAYSAQTGSEADKLRIARDLAMRQVDANGASTAPAMRPEGPATVTYGQQGTPTSFTRNKKQVDQFRNKRGQFDRQGQMLSSEEIEDIGTVMRSELLAAYDEKIGEGHGGEQTHALRAAIAKSVAVVERNDETGFQISMPLPDEPGAPRQESGQYRAPRPSTGIYGKYVFMGRGSIRAMHRVFETGMSGREAKGRTFMRFQMFGEYITTNTVLPSRTDLNIYDMDAERRARIASSVQEKMTAAGAEAIA